jgi:hypothetical protein
MFKLQKKVGTMKQTIIPMKADAKLVIRGSADLFIQGGSQPQLIATVNDGDSFRMRDETGAYYLNSNSNTKLVVPETASLVIERVGGDASISSMKGNVEVQKVGGDLILQSLAALNVDTVGGDIVFKELTGPVEIKRVGGDLEGFKIGDLAAYFVGGDVAVSGALGKVQIVSGGDTRLQFNIAQIPETQVRAGGDIQMTVLPNSTASLQIESDGEKIVVNACGQELEVEKESYTLPLGEGGAAVVLNAGSEVEIREGKETVNEFAAIFDDLGSSWRDFGKEIEDRVRRSMRGVNHSVRRASWEASDAVRGVADKFDQFARNVNPGNSDRVVGFDFSPEQAAPVNEKKAASDEERMLVLKMLQDKKITVEEAEKLLQALEG